MKAAPTSSTHPLFDPERNSAPLSIDGEKHSVLLADWEMMWLIRLAEEKIGDMVTAGKIACPCHLGIGQEAVAVGVSRHLRKTDRIFGAHRSHSHYLASGGSVEKLFAEVLGREAGSSRGMGGSMHLFGEEHGFKGSVPIVAGTIPLAVGAGLAAKMDGRGDVAVSYFGDGAVEEGVFHESLNLASAMRLPVLFVCENNLFSSHLHIRLRQPDWIISRFAEAHRVPHRLVDGNDVVAVAKATRELLEESRAFGVPGFLEAVTYRWRGHVGPREDVDVGVDRHVDLQAWKKCDPIRRMAEAMVGKRIASEKDLEERRGKIVERIETAWSFAEKAPFPPPSALLERVYRA